MLRLCECSLGVIARECLGEGSVDDGDEIWILRAQIVGD